MECLSSRCERGAPGGRARENRKFIQAPSPEIWSEAISGGEEVLAGKWGGLFCATSLEKIFGGTTTLGAAKGRAHRVARSRQGLPHSLRHLRSSPPRRYHPADLNCERIRSEHS